MEPVNFIMWAVCLGVAWIIFSSLTGADEWLKSLFGKSKSGALEKRIQDLERRLAILEKK